MSKCDEARKFSMGDCGPEEQTEDELLNWNRISYTHSAELDAADMEIDAKQHKCYNLEVLTRILGEALQHLNFERLNCKGISIETIQEVNKALFDYKDYKEGKEKNEQR